MNRQESSQISNGVNKLVAKIKNIFGRDQRPEMIEPKKDSPFSEAMQGTNDIARSIRESSRIQKQKNLWRRIFHF